MWRAFLALAAACWVAGCGEDVSVAGSTGKSRAPMAASVEPDPPPPVPKNVEIVWPTPNDVYLRGGMIEEFVQPTVSGEVRSGLFGSVRSGGLQFHEGVDLFPVSRDKKGEALDPIYAAMAGVVRHVSRREGASSYGRYVVLEHPEQSPPVYTLYAHLSRIDPGLFEGRTVAAGEILGTMGRSAGGYTIPKNRAHLHFEIGVRMTDRFQEWYDSRRFGSPNEHGIWNGMNLMGMAPLDFYARHRAGGMRSLDEVFASTPVAITMRVFEPREPDFVRRYPSLVSAETEIGAGWEIGFSVTGVPLRWKRLGASGFAGWRPGERRIESVDTELLNVNRGRKLIEYRKGVAYPGPDLRTVLEQLW